MRGDIPLEARKMWHLTDAQVLEAMRGRGNELATARAMEFLCRMFDKAAESNPTCAPGLKAARGLTEQYAILAFAPGHEAHPFKGVDKVAHVASILARAAEPVQQQPGRLHRPGHKPVVVEEVVPVSLREVTARPSTDELAAPWNVQGVDHGRLESRLPPPMFNHERKPRAPWIRGAGSKVGRMSAIILGLDPDMAFGIGHLRGLKPADLTDQDLNNALMALQKKGKVIRVGKLWSVVQPAAETAA